MHLPLSSVRTLVDEGVHCARAGQFGESGLQFFRALQAVEELPDGTERDEQFSAIAVLCLGAGHPDIALFAMQSLLQSLHRSSEPGRRGGDLLTLANTWEKLGRSDAAACVNELVLLEALKDGRMADAASASTNLAVHDGNRGHLEKSLERLQKSLEYIATEPHPDTEAITRLSLLQVVDAMNADPAIALHGSGDLFTRLEPYVGPARWQTAAPAFHRLVDRYLAAHPELDGDAWRQERFPLVFGRGNQ